MLKKRLGACVWGCAGGALEAGWTRLGAAALSSALRSRADCSAWMNSRQAASGWRLMAASSRALR